MLNLMVGFYIEADCFVWFTATTGRLMAMSGYTTPPIGQRIGFFEHKEMVLAYRLLLDDAFRKNVLTIGLKSKKADTVRLGVQPPISTGKTSILGKGNKKYPYVLTHTEIDDLQKNILKVLKDADITDLGELKVGELQSKYFDKFNKKIDYFVRDFGPEEDGFKG